MPRTLTSPFGFNPNSGDYEVYALPDFSDPAYFVGGGSQLSLVFTRKYCRCSLIYKLPLLVDYGRITLGFLPQQRMLRMIFMVLPLMVPSCLLLQAKKYYFFTFPLPGGGCIGGIRLYENGVDPNSAAPGMGGGDFENYFCQCFHFRR